MDNDQEAQALLMQQTVMNLTVELSSSISPVSVNPEKVAAAVISTVAVEIVVEAAVTTPIVVEETVEATTEVAVDNRSIK